jgi:hypothetical protein
LSSDHRLNLPSLLADSKSLKAANDLSDELESKSTSSLDKGEVQD